MKLLLSIMEFSQYFLSVELIMCYNTIIAYSPHVMIFDNGVVQ